MELDGPKPQSDWTALIRGSGARRNPSKTPTKDQ